MSRELRTMIPTQEKQMKPQVVNYRKYKQFIEENKNKMAKYYNRGTKPLKPLKEGETIMFKKTPQTSWKEGKIIEKLNEPRSYIITDNEGHLYRRNRSHIIENKGISEGTKKEIIESENNVELKTDSPIEQKK